MRVLILVLSADFSPYDRMINTAINTWDSIEVDGVETIFYCGESTKTNTDKIIYINATDYLLNIGHKTLGAFEWALKNKEFDFIARVHSSIYVDKIRLLEYVQSLPKENLFSGTEAESQNGFQYVWGGTGYILSKDVISKIVENKSVWKHQFMEDESMSLVASGLGIPFTLGYAGSIDKMSEGWRCISYGGESITFNEFSELKRLRHHYYRCKQDGHRLRDQYVMEHLFKNL